MGARQCPQVTSCRDEELCIDEDQSASSRLEERRSPYPCSLSADQMGFEAIERPVAWTRAEPHGVEARDHVMSVSRARRRSRRRRIGNGVVLSHETFLLADAHEVRHDDPIIAGEDDQTHFALGSRVDR